MSELVKRGVALVLALVICVGLLPSLTIVGDAANYIYNWGERGKLATAPSEYADSFYTGNYTYDILSGLSGGTSESNVPNSALYKALHTLMESKHSYQTSYDATRDKFQYTDCQNGGGKISSFYSGKLVGPSWDGGSTWNREHTWPNSKGDASGNGENDIMMLRPASVSENSSRGNKAYGTSGSFYDPNNESGGTYNLHGDVARIVLYVYVRWECTNTGSKYNPNGIFGADGIIESLDVLLAWMEEDPVDTWELGRNDAVQSITGTRNVFVDYPELAFLLFGEEIPAGLTTPSGEGANKCDHENFKEVVTAPTCTEPGYTTYICQVDGCNYRYKADHTPATGHNYVEGLCSVCGAENIGVVTSPVVGAAYKFGMIQESVSATDVYYIDGTMQSTYYLGTTTDYSAGLDVYLESASGGYYLYTRIGGAKKYINMVVSGTHVNGVYQDAASTVYTYSAARQTLVTQVDGVEYCFGTRDDKTYTTVGPVKVSDSFHCKLYGKMGNQTACQHTSTKVVGARAAGCASEGYTGDTVCSACGMIVKEGQKIAAIGHNYVNGTCNVCGANQSAVSEATISFATTANRTEFTTSKQVWEQNGITVTNNKDKSTSNVADYANPARFYKSSQLIIAYPGMTKIVFNCNTTSYATDLKTSIGTVSGATVTVNGKAVTVEFASAVNSFTISLTGGQVRMDSLEVSTGNGGSGGTTEHQHSYTHVAKVEATCTVDGMQEHDKCAGCGKLFVNGVEKSVADLKIPATGHSHASVVTAPTCTAGGYTTYTCSCGNSYVDNRVNALGHNEIHHNAKAPTCTEKGWDAYVTCSRCNHSTYVEKAALGHGLAHHDGKAPTCTEDGWKAYDTCSRCDYSTYEAIKATGHNHTPVVTAPTCTAGGYTTYTCSCGNSYVENRVDPLGHAWDAGTVIQAPTEQKEGQRKHTCTRCGETKVETIPALGHTHNYTPVVTAPTCTAGGYTTYTCSCGNSYVENRVDPLGHAWDAGTVIQEPTEQKEGQRKHSCTRCGETKVETIPALGHTHNHTPVVTAPTCTAGGYTTYTCSCGNSYVENRVDPLGHAWDAGTVIQAPTEQKEGQRKHSCTRCGETKVETIPALGHTHNYTPVVTAPTCTEKGYTVYTCGCGNTYTENYVDALGHSFTKYVSDKNATTEADGTKTAQCDHGCGQTHTVVDEGSKITQSDITSDIYDINDGYISKIGHSTTVESMMAGLNNNANVEVYRDGKPVSGDTVLGTGMVIRRVVGGEVVAEAVVVVTGDTSGDGKITITDMLAIKAHLLKKGALDGASGQAADVSGDSGISITDFIQLKAHILGKSEIKP